MNVFFEELSFSLKKISYFKKLVTLIALTNNTLDLSKYNKIAATILDK